MLLRDLAKLRSVGVDQVGQALAVTVLLRLAVVVSRELADVLANVLSLAPPDGDLATVEHEIRRADAGDVLGFVDNRDVRRDRSKSASQRRAETVFCGLSAGMERADFSQITLNVHNRFLLPARPVA